VGQKQACGICSVRGCATYHKYKQILTLKNLELLSFILFRIVLFLFFHFGFGALEASLFLYKIIFIKIFVMVNTAANYCFTWGYIRGYSCKGFLIFHALISFFQIQEPQFH